MAGSKLRCNPAINHEIFFSGLIFVLVLFISAN